jgi:hypothetical protein
MASKTAPKKPHERPTDPPPRPKERTTIRPPKGDDDGRLSGMRTRRDFKADSPAATVDEVVADLSRDPRHERDEDD